MQPQMVLRKTLMNILYKSINPQFHDSDSVGNTLRCALMHTNFRKATYRRKIVFNG